MSDLLSVVSDFATVWTFVGAGVSTAVWWFWAAMSATPPPMVFAAGLGVFASVAAILTVARYLRAFNHIYLLELVDPLVENIVWQVRVHKSFDGRPGARPRRIIALCGLCRVGMHVENRPHANCDECGVTHADHEDFNTAKGRVLAKAKGAWENGKVGYVRTADSERHD